MFTGMQGVQRITRIGICGVAASAAIHRLRQSIDCGYPSTAAKNASAQDTTAQDATAQDASAHTAQSAWVGRAGKMADQMERTGRITTEIGRDSRL